jgi:hypothetical protein
MVRISGLHPVFLAVYASNGVFAHQSSHPWPGSFYALLLQLHCYSGAAIATIALLVNLLNRCQQLLLFSGSQANWVLEPVIIPTDAHSKHLTHLLDRELGTVFFYKSHVYRPSPLEKMLTAFFRISLSN